MTSPSPSPNEAREIVRILRDLPGRVATVEQNHAAMAAQINLLTDLVAILATRVGVVKEVRQVIAGASLQSLRETNFDETFVMDRRSAASVGGGVGS